MPKRQNVVLIVLDDLGFSDLGCFGSDIETPNLDRLAAQGLRYTSFHATPLCSPSRACYLTGRNHHAVEWGNHNPRNAPGYTGRIPPSAATIGRMLQGAGYRTAAFGKWHNTPYDELGEARHGSTAARDGSGVRPTRHWPRAMGFDEFYGFVNAGGTDQYLPNLVRGEELVDPPRTPEQGYHLTEDLADEAIRFIGDGRDAEGAGDPFFAYVATGAVHIPHQAPRAFIEPYRGRFDSGWDVERERRFARQLELGVVPEGTTLTERVAMVPAWNDLTDLERRVFARQMETYAGFVSHTDAQIGRILDHLEAIGAAEDTLVMVVSDNGAEGGTLNGAFDGEGFIGDGGVERAAEHLDEFGAPGSLNAYASGWAWAGSTPLRMWKYYTWLGGVRVPLIVRWPTGIDASQTGSIRRQFGHAIDLAPTILDVAGVEPPSTVDGVAQQPIDGASLTPTFVRPDAPAPRSTQYFEMYGSRSIIHDGWKATTDHVPGTDHNFAGPPGWRLVGSLDFASDRWSLFDLERDFSEAHDLADEHPERLAELIAVWERDAERDHIHPMSDVVGPVEWES